MNEKWLAVENLGGDSIYLPLPVSPRKSRLFACACCYRLNDWLDPEAREALSVAERYADGSASEAERRKALRTLIESCGGEIQNETAEAIRASLPLDLSLHVTALAIATHADDLWCGASGRCIPAVFEPTSHYQTCEWQRKALYLVECYVHRRRNAVRGYAGRVWNRFLHHVARLIDPALEAALDRKIRTQEVTHQIALINDIFGNTFRPVSFSPSWRTDTALSLAGQMYESRDFGAMPILADALQDAGCEDEAILSHCRDAKQLHVRGCWLVDLVLEKA